MLEPEQIGLGVLAVLIMVGVPVVVMIGFDAAVGRFDDALLQLRNQRIRQQLLERMEHRRNVRALKRQTGAPIERLGYDVRRLRQTIQASENSSATQQVGLRQAYDKVLTQLCAMLELRHELDQPTGGLERDIERVRVEAMLEANGIVINDQRRHDQNA